jgi:hypothetical protein
MFRPLRRVDVERCDSTRFQIQPMTVAPNVARTTQLSRHSTMIGMSSRRIILHPHTLADS